MARTREGESLQFKRYQQKEETEIKRRESTNFRKGTNKKRINPDRGGGKTNSKRAKNP